MVQYHDQNGVPGDEWGSHLSNYFEYNVTSQDFHNLTIYEPCNYVSNLAYYHVTTMICDHLGNFNMPQDAVAAMGIMVWRPNYDSSLAMQDSIFQEKYLCIRLWALHFGMEATQGWAANLTTGALTFLPSLFIKLLFRTCQIMTIPS